MLFIYSEDWMPQILKDETRTAIVQAALTVFAQKGFRDTSMQDVSRLAGLSAGNIYRYFPDKRALYAAALPPELMAELQATLDRKIASWEGKPLSTDPKANAGEIGFRLELIDLLIQNRLQWIALLRDGKPDALTDRLTAFFERWLGSVRTVAVLDEKRRTTVRLLYRNLITLIASVLGENQDPSALREALENCIDYHMAGLAAVMEKWGKE